MCLNITKFLDSYSRWSSASGASNRAGIVKLERRKRSRGRRRLRRGRGRDRSAEGRGRKGRLLLGDVLGILHGKRLDDAPSELQQLVDLVWAVVPGNERESG